MNMNTETSTLSLLTDEAEYDPIEDRLRQNIRNTIEAVCEEELAHLLGRCRYDQIADKPAGYRYGHRECQSIGTFGTETVSVPRARVVTEGGKTEEWRSRGSPSLSAADE